MWHGSFSPNTGKKILRKSVDGGSFLSDDGRSEDELNSPDDDEVVGTITVTLSGTDYQFPDKTFGDYVEFENSGFSGSWVNENLDIDHVGDWGWPWGRTERTGWAAGKEK